MSKLVRTRRVVVDPESIICAYYTPESVEGEKRTPQSVTLIFRQKPLEGSQQLKIIDCPESFLDTLTT
ncbi:MAG: hypothetical protein K1Y36_10450 [Blastocatellia bacterium]|nr:hypothetical protein [Blastocatellia bacterium]HMZ79159.1 hypothetical protein [Acidobacteriota bacterium]